MESRDASRPSRSRCSNNRRIISLLALALTFSTVSAGAQTVFQNGDAVPDNATVVTFLNDNNHNSKLQNLLWVRGTDVSNGISFGRGGISSTTTESSSGQIVGQVPGQLVFSGGDMLLQIGDPNWGGKQFWVRDDETRQTLKFHGFSWPAFGISMLVISGGEVAVLIPLMKASSSYNPQPLGKLDYVSIGVGAVAVIGGFLYGLRNSMPYLEKVN